LEVVLAVTLALGAVGAVLAFNQRVLELRGQIFGDVEAIASQRAVMGKLTDELRSAIAYPFLGGGMSGQSGQIQFVSVVLPSLAVWAPRTAIDNPPPPEQDIQFVTYRLRYATDERGVALVDEQGNPIVAGLERSCQKVLASGQSSVGPQISTSLLTANVKYLSLRYWDGGSWLTGWSRSDLPPAIEIVIGAAPPVAGMTLDDYQAQHESFRRVVYIPGGAKAAGGTAIIRGL
jgi:hypothetical protein